MERGIRFVVEKREGWRGREGRRKGERNEARGGGKDTTRKPLSKLSRVVFCVAAKCSEQVVVVREGRCTKRGDSGDVRERGNNK